MSLIEKQIELLDKSILELENLKKEVGNLEKIRKEIELEREDIKTIPGKFSESFDKVKTLAESFVSSIGGATKTYLDGNNALFATNLGNLEKETKNLKNNTDALEEQVERLENVDFEEDFNKLQSTLAKIIEAINGVNLNLTTITRSLTQVNQELGDLHSLINANYNKTKNEIELFKDITERKLNAIDQKIDNHFRELESKISSISQQNEALKKEVNTNRIIQIIGIVLMIIGLIVLIGKLS